MEEQEVEETLRLEFFCRVVVVRMHAEVKELQEAHSSWGPFKEALGQAYGEPARS